MNYKKHYNKLMAKAPKVKTKGIYRERHRIVPGFAGGKYIESNIACLTPEEHYVAHQLLIKIYKGTELYSKAVYAAHRMTKGTSRGIGRNNKTYGWLRREFSKVVSKFMTGRTAWNKGIKNPDASKRMIERNPMKNPKVAAKVTAKNKGRISSNKILKVFIWSCMQCKKTEERRDTVKNHRKEFCNKSCAATWGNTHRIPPRGWGFKRARQRDDKI